MSGAVQGLIGAFNSAYLPPLPPSDVPDDFEFLIHFDAVDGSSRFVEESGKQIENYGSATLEPTIKKFGSDSGAFVDGGIRVSLLTSFGLKDFTLCAWFYWDGTDTGDDVGLFGFSPLSPMSVRLDRSNGYALTYNGGGGDVVATASGDFTSSAWHFVCVERVAGVLSLTLDGVTAGTAPARISYGILQIFIGIIDGTSQAFNGFIDDAMLQLGAAYFGGGDFTVPTGAFTSTGSSAPSPAPSPSPSPAPAVRTPGAGSIAITRYVPDFAVTGPQFVTPGAGGITLATFVPGFEVSGASSGTDTYFADVVLLLHGNGPNSSTTSSDFIDSSEQAHTASLGSNVSLTTADKKYGSAAIAFAGTGTADNLKYFQATDEFTMDTQDFTWEGWIKPSLLSGLRVIIGSRETVDAGPLVFTTGTALRAFTFDNVGGTFGDVTGGTVDTSSWHHWAYVRSGTTFTLFLDGTSVGTPATSSTASPNAATLVLGVDSSTAGREFQGLIDDVRITKGVARYGSNFTPPTLQFADAGPASTVEITPGAGSLTVTGKIPAFVIQGSVTCTPAAASIAITGYAPALAAASDTTITPAAGAASYTGYAPALATANDITITPAAGAAAYTGYALAVVATGNAVITPAVGSASYTGYAAAAATNGPTTITPNAGSASYTGYAPVINSAAFDGLTANIWAAYGLKKLLTSYSGSAVRVRRDSDDTTLDIGFTGSGDLDTSALASFAASGSAYVTKWYDQSGGGNDLVQATFSKQALLYYLGSYFAKVHFDGDDAFASTNSSGTPTGFTLATDIHQRDFSGTYIQFEHSPNSNSSNSPATYSTTVAFDLYISNGGSNTTDLRFLTSLPKTPYVFRFDSTQVTNAAQVKLTQNGSDVSNIGDFSTGSVPTATFSSAVWYVGGRGASSLFAPIEMSVLVIYETVKSDPDVASITAAIALASI